MLLLCGAVTTALLAIGGVLWWLIWPRIEDKLQEMVRSLSRVETKLGDDPDTVGRYARVAAGAAAELPGIKERLDTLAAAQQAVEDWRRDVDRRLGGVEQVMVALAGPELRRRLFEDLQHDLDTREPPT